MSGAKPVTVSKLVAIWLSAHCAPWKEHVRNLHAEIDDCSRRYLANGDETFLDGLGWHTITAAKQAETLDFEWHHSDILFTTNCADETLTLFISRRLPRSLLETAKEDAGIILGSSKLTLPQMSLCSHSATKGVTSLVFHVENLRV